MAMGEQWAETTLGNVADFVNGYPFKPADLAGLTYPVIRIKQLLDASAEIDYTDLNTPERNHIKNGDLIFSWSGTLASRIWSRGPAALNQHLFKVNERPGIDRGWLHLALDHAVEELSEKTHGTTMKHITKGVLETHSIRLPPLPVQRRIADLVAHLDNHIADLQSERDAASRVLVRMRATQMEPNGDWKAGRLDQVAEVRLGRMLSKERSSGDDLAPYIRNANVQWNALNLADLKQMSFPTKEREIYALRAGDILVCEGGDPGDSQGPLLRVC
jgi:type I restriction enzyme S subunit